MAGSSAFICELMLQCHGSTRPEFRLRLRASAWPACPSSITTVGADIGKAKVKAAEMAKVKAAALVNLLNGEKEFPRALAETAISAPNLLRQRPSLVLSPPRSQTPQLLRQKPV